MFYLRPVKPQDLNTLDQFAKQTSLGMRSLPKDRNLLEKKIMHSFASWKKKIEQPSDELYLFILENSETGEVVGCCGIYARAGTIEPLYCYRIETLHPRFKQLPLPSTQKILHPCQIQHGPSELCALFLAPQLRREKLGELLSLSRFLFIASHPHRFANKIVAFLRGAISLKNNNSPFWDGLGRHFLHMNFSELMRLLDTSAKSCIPHFFPTHPIYVSLLPKKAQEVIQKTHTSTKPALKMLNNEGFTFTDYIDPFEAGPLLQAEPEKIRTIQTNVETTVFATTTKCLPTKRYIVSNTNPDFRACYAKLKIRDDKSVILSNDVATALSAKPGDPIRYVSTQHNEHTP